MQAESESDDTSYSEVHATFKTPVSAKRRKPSISSTSSSSASTPTTIDPDSVHSALKQASDTLKNITSPVSKDELDHYGAMVACQLRTLTEEQRSMAMLRFSQMIHEIKFLQPHPYVNSKPTTSMLNSIPSHSSTNMFSQPDHSTQFNSNSTIPNTNQSHSTSNMYSLPDHYHSF